VVEADLAAGVPSKVAGQDVALEVSEVAHADYSTWPLAA
jgi:hypothetical protein